MPCTCAQALNGVSSNLEGLSASCSTIFTTLAAAKAATQQLSSESERLQAEVDALELKSRTAAQFLAQYQVTEQEVRLLLFVFQQSRTPARDRHANRGRRL
jgi:hypothetical protein